MPSHHYSITVQPTDAAGTAEAGAPLAFSVTNHDDIFAILARIQAIEPVPRTEAAEFVVGLKLLLDVIARHRKDALFQDIWPHMIDFMKQLKAMLPRDAPVETAPT